MDPKHCLPQEPRASALALDSGVDLRLVALVRRLNVDYERLPASPEVFIYIAMIRLMLRSIA